MLVFKTAQITLEQTRPTPPETSINPTLICVLEQVCLLNY